MQDTTLEDIKQRLREELETILACTLTDRDDGRELHELGVDSMSLVELLLAIEKIYRVRLLESGITSKDLRTLQGLAHVIHRASP